MTRPVDDRGDSRQEDDREEDDVAADRCGGEEVDATVRRRILLLELVGLAEDDDGRDEGDKDAERREDHQPELHRVVRHAPTSARRVADGLRSADPREELHEPDRPTDEETDPLQAREAADAHRAKAGDVTVSVTTIVRTMTAYQ